MFTIVSREALADLWPKPESEQTSPRRISKPTVMSALPHPQRSIMTGTFADARCRPFTFGCGVLLVIHWLDMENKTSTDLTVWCVMKTSVPLLPKTDSPRLNTNTQTIKPRANARVDIDRRLRRRILRLIHTVQRGNCGPHPSPDRFDIGHDEIEYGFRRSEIAVAVRHVRFKENRVALGKRH
jgi:hypothetical protein